jgi:hypothetical protein
MLSSFLNQVGQLVQDYTHQANYALAAADDEYLAQFQDQKTLRAMKKTTTTLSPRQRFKKAARKLQSQRRHSVEFSAAEMEAALAATQSAISESQVSRPRRGGSCHLL